MKKVNILKKNIDFDRIIKNQKPYKYKEYIIYIERKEPSYYNFGVTVSTKIGNAVTRNKIKRQLKNIIDEKNYQNNFNCIIIVRKSVLESDFLKMKENLFVAFKNLNIIKEQNNEE